MERIERLAERIDALEREVRELEALRSRRECDGEGENELVEVVVLVMGLAAIVLLGLLVWRAW